MEKLLHLMERLRDPADGCPWDRQQSFRSIAPYTLEEAYEVADAIDSGDMLALREELGDLLFQVVFHAQMASEAGLFSFDDVVVGICEKMERRHPHVFGEAVIETAEEQTRAWEQHKQRERAAKGSLPADVPSALDGLTAGLSSVLRAKKIQKQAAKMGFDWPEPGGVLEKLREEIEELEGVIARKEGSDRLEEEMGDLLFSAVNLARHLRCDPELSLRRANRKFERRFRTLEAVFAAEGKTLSDASLSEMNEIWERIKQDESSSANA